MQGKIRELREALEGDDLDRIKQLTEEVQQASYALSQQLYAQQGDGAPESAAEGPAPEGEAPGGEEEGDVVEGEFREA